MGETRGTEPPSPCRAGNSGRQEQGHPRALAHSVLSAGASHCCSFVFMNPCQGIAREVFNFLWFHSEHASLGTEGTFSVLLNVISVQTEQRKNILIITGIYGGWWLLAADFFFFYFSPSDESFKVSWLHRHKYARNKMCRCSGVWDSHTGTVNSPGSWPALPAPSRQEGSGKSTLLQPAQDLSFLSAASLNVSYLYFCGKTWIQHSINILSGG